MRSQQPCVCSGYEWSALAVFCVLVRSSSYNSAWACAAGSFWELLVAWWGLRFQHLASRCWSEVSLFLQLCCLRHFRSWCFSYHPGCSEHMEKKVWGLSELGLRCKMLFQQQMLGRNLTCKWCLWASDTSLVINVSVSMPHDQMKLQFSLDSNSVHPRQYEVVCGLRHSQITTYQQINSTFLSLLLYWHGLPLQWGLSWGKMLPLGPSEFPNAGDSTAWTQTLIHAKIHRSELL